jgi:hypothetical protein
MNRRLAGAALAAGLLPFASGAAAQDGLPALDDLPPAPASTLSTKLEKTIFKVDVLDLSLRVDSTAADRLARLRDAEPRYEDRLEAPVADAVRVADSAVAEIVFLRDVRLGQFLDGVDDDMSRAERAGWIDRDTYERVRDGIASWFAGLRNRGLRKGDRLLYRIREDTLRTVYVTGAGEVLVDQVDVGRDNVLTLLGGYLAPGASMRRGLIRSLWTKNPGK